MSCDHTEYNEEEWVSGSYNEDGEWESGYFTGGTSHSTCVDIDLHRYRCTKCNKVMYYSQAAREYYEQGKLSPHIKGLDR